MTQILKLLALIEGIRQLTNKLPADKKAKADEMIADLKRKGKELYTYVADKASGSGERRNWMKEFEEMWSSTFSTPQAAEPETVEGQAAAYRSLIDQANKLSEKLSASGATIDIKIMFVDMVNAAELKYPTIAVEVSKKL